MNFLRPAVMAACALLLCACSTAPIERQEELARLAVPQETYAQARPAAEPPVYRIQVGDVLDLRFPVAAELNETVTVRPDGKVSAAWVGDVRAAGLTPTEMATGVREAYAGVLRQPRVDVLVRTFQPPRIFIAGEVVRPGELQMIGSLSVWQAIVRSGDFTADAQRDSVVVLRQNGTGEPDYILLDFANPAESRLAVSVNKPCAPDNPLACGSRPLRPEAFTLQPLDLVFVPKTRVAGVAQFFERYISQIVPLYRNMGLTFTYPLNNRNQVIIPSAATPGQ